MVTPDTSGPNGEEPIDDTEMGEPVAELRTLSLDVDDRLGRRVRGSIERRVLAGDLLGLAWNAPLMILLEFIRAPFELFKSKPGS
jgi:hypothetical protein